MGICPLASGVSAAPSISVTSINSAVMSSFAAEALFITPTPASMTSIKLSWPSLTTEHPPGALLVLSSLSWTHFIFRHPQMLLQCQPQMQCWHPCCSSCTPSSAASAAPAVLRRTRRLWRLRQLAGTAAEGSCNPQTQNHRDRIRCCRHCRKGDQSGSTTPSSAEYWSLWSR